MCYEDRHDWSYVRVLLPSLNGRGFEFGVYNIVHESNEMSFGWCFIIYLVFWKTCSSLTIFWSRTWSGTMNTLRVFNPYNVVMWVDEMSCRKGVWKFGTLWEHPVGKGEATCHSSSWYSFMHGGLVDNLLLKRSVQWTYSFGHNVLLVFGLIILWHSEMSVISVDLSVVYWSVLHLILDSTWIWYSLLLELKIPTLAWHWDFLLCLRHWEVYSLQVMRTYSWKLLEKSLS